MIKIAAVGDIHYDLHSGGRLSSYLGSLEGHADLLVIAGDLTQIGSIEEMTVLAKDLAECPVPVVTIFGNHDYHSDLQERCAELLTVSGITVLEGQSTTFTFHSQTVGIVGLKGFGGGFVGACGSDFGEPEMKNFIRFTKSQAELLRNGLRELKTDYKIALTHYSPVEETLLGEKKEIYPFLGSYLLAEAIDDGGADLAFHGHAHRGVEKGLTPGGTPVRNVAMPVIRHAYNIYCLNKEGVSHQPRPFSSLSFAESAHH